MNLTTATADPFALENYTQDFNYGYPTNETYDGKFLLTFVPSAR